MDDEHVIAGYRACLLIYLTISLGEGRKPAARLVWFDGTVCCKYGDLGQAENSVTRGSRAEMMTPRWMSVLLPAICGRTVGEPYGSLRVTPARPCINVS